MDEGLSGVSEHDQPIPLYFFAILFIKNPEFPPLVVPDSSLNFQSLIFGIFTSAPRLFPSQHYGWKDVNE
jgi:hypothetical protein